MMRLAILIALVTLVIAPAAHAQLYVIENFDSYDAAATANGAVLFRQPSFSGSTSAQLDATDVANNQSKVVAGPALSDPNSLHVQWLWTDTGEWLRLTTFGAPNRPNPAIDYSLVLQMDVLYTSGDDLGIAVLTRDNGTAAAIGDNGGTAGAIEVIGATGFTTAGGPTGAKVISAAPGWQTISWNIPMENLSTFTGNGVLDNATGTIEALAIKRLGGAGPYSLHIDNVVMVPEPASMLVLGAGLTGLAGMIRRRRA